MHHNVTYMQSLKYGTNEPSYETNSQMQRTDLVAKVGEGRGRRWEFGVSGCKLLPVERINNKVLLQSTGDDIQCPEVGHNGNKRKKDVYMCVTESLCCTAEINTTL